MPHEECAVEGGGEAEKGHDSSRCIFCGIINGTEPAQVLYRDESVIAFRDIREKARIQFLVCPIAHIATVNDLGPGHRPLLVHMKKVGENVLQRLHNESTLSGRKLRAGYGFHRPPFNSINHLHLHVYAYPRTWRGYVEYSGFWFTSMKKLLSNL